MLITIFILLMIFTLFGDVKFEKRWNSFLFEVRLKSSHLGFNIPILKINSTRKAK